METSVLVSIEAMDASFQMKKIDPDLLALDLTANPNSFGIGCPMTVAFMQAHPAFSGNKWDEPSLVLARLKQRCSS